MEAEKAKYEEFVAAEKQKYEDYVAAQKKAVRGRYLQGEGAHREARPIRIWPIWWLRPWLCWRCWLPWLRLWLPWRIPRCWLPILLSPPCQRAPTRWGPRRTASRVLLMVEAGQRRILSLLLSAASPQPIPPSGN